MPWCQRHQGISSYRVNIDIVTCYASSIWCSQYLPTGSQLVMFLHSYHTNATANTNLTITPSNPGVTDRPRGYQQLPPTSGLITRGFLGETMFRIICSLQNTRKESNIGFYHGAWAQWRPYHTSNKTQWLMINNWFMIMQNSNVTLWNMMQTIKYNNHICW